MGTRVARRGGDMSIINEVHPLHKQVVIDKQLQELLNERVQEREPIHFTQHYPENDPAVCNHSCGISCLSFSLKV